MKIELTDDEVREVGEARYKGRWTRTVPLGLSLMLMVIAAILGQHFTIGKFFLLEVAPMFLVFYFYWRLVRELNVAGRRFLEEQKKLNGGK